VSYSHDTRVLCWHCQKSLPLDEAVWEMGVSWCPAHVEQAKRTTFLPAGKDNQAERERMEQAEWGK